MFKLPPPAPGAVAWCESVIYAFRRRRGPSSVRAAARGRPRTLYGISEDGGVYYANGSGGPGCGVLFELTPPVAGATRWTEHVLFSFGQYFGGIKFAPSYPLAPLSADARGRVYGAAVSGGAFGYGAAFRLTPPAVGYNWTEADLRRFRQRAGRRRSPESGLLISRRLHVVRKDRDRRDGVGTVYEIVFS